MCIHGKTPKLFLGIDLGTTNSSVCWGSERPDGKFEVSVISFDMMLEDESMGKRELLPSFVFFPEDGNPPIIGPRAKSMLGTQAFKVLKSVKSLIGKSLEANQLKTLNRDKKQYLPENISAMFLKELLRGVKDFVGQEINDVIITVPASFDSDMRAATRKAAEEAGIITTNDDGSFRNILLDEPRASIFDWVNQCNNGSIETSIIDFKDPQMVLVYDLGGGTLDVSLHILQNVPGEKYISIRDIAISRYHNVGGDLFDDRLGDFLYQDYIKSKNINEKNINELEKREILAKLTHYGEQWKVQLTNKINVQRRFNQALDFRTINEKISPGFLFEKKFYSRNLDMKTYEDIMQDMLRYDLKYPQTLEELNSLKLSEDIISPIIDVIKTAANHPEFKNKIVKPPIILLAGGMTRVHLVQDRLEKFFGVKPKTFLDPDKSVSRGATVYHYYLHNGFKPSTILAEDIIMKDNFGFKKIIEAGTIITESRPYSKILDMPWALSNSNCTQYALQFYRSDENHPILKRTYALSKPYPKGTSVGIEVAINTEKIMEFTIWLVGKQNLRLEEQKMKIETEQEENFEDISVIKADRKEKEKHSEQPSDPEIKITSIKDLHEKIPKIISKNAKSLSEIITELNVKEDMNLKTEIQRFMIEKSKIGSIERIIQDEVPYYRWNSNPRISISLDRINQLINHANQSGNLEFDGIDSDKIINAKNSSEILKILLKTVASHKIKRAHVKNQIYRLFGKAIKRRQYTGVSEDFIDKVQHEFISFLEYMIDYEKLNPTIINNGVRIVINGLGDIQKIDPPRRIIEIFEKILNSISFLSVRQFVFIALSKLPPDIEIIEILQKQFIESVMVKGQADAIFLAIGKQTSRYIPNPILFDRIKSLLINVLDEFNRFDDFELIRISGLMISEMINPKIEYRQKHKDIPPIESVIDKIEKKKGQLVEIFNSSVQGEDPLTIQKLLARKNQAEICLNISLKRLKQEELNIEEKEFLFDCLDSKNE